MQAIVRVSFQSNVRQNQAANRALVGHTQNKTGSGPFERVSTATYAATGPIGSLVDAIAALVEVISNGKETLDFFTVTLTNSGTDKTEIESNH